MRPREQRSWPAPLGHSLRKWWVHQKMSAGAGSREARISRAFPVGDVRGDSDKSLLGPFADSQGDPAETPARQKLPLLEEEEIGYGGRVIDRLMRLWGRERLAFAGEGSKVQLHEADSDAGLGMRLGGSTDSKFNG